MRSRTPSDRTTQTLAGPVAADARRSHSPAAAVFAPGEMIDDRFRIVRFLGQGGMGQVFEAQDLELGTGVALKILRPEISRKARAVERFKREVLLARQVTHPNVCRIFDLFQIKNQAVAWGKGGPPVLFLTMELVSGETLAQRLHESGALRPQQALPLIRCMAAALDAAHQAGIVHRDFKSANVLLRDSDRGAVVTDFGLAQALHAAEASVARSPGEPAAAPDLEPFGGLLGSPRASRRGSRAGGLLAARRRRHWHTGGERSHCRRSRAG